MFSMIIGWPSVRVMCSLTMRAVTSVTPPAAKGTIIVIGRDGYVWALAICNTIGSAAAPAARCRNCRRGSIIAVPPSRVTSLDHLVGAGEQRGGHFEAERLCRI